MMGKRAAGTWRRAVPVLAALCLLGAAGAAAAPLEEPRAAIRRYALMIGSSQGGAGREQLRYTGSDALALSQVMEELGGVATGDRLLLLEADRATLLTAISRMRQLVASAKPSEGRKELVFYYSGHSDAEGLLPRGELLPYEELRRLLSEVPVDVRIAILDSCGSGALTRSKGGVRRPSFLSDLSSQVRGHAFLASSSADEVAQEADSLGASFFTHFLISGLRGAADANGDGRVTLNEAYQFSYHETLARTERSQSGPQHAAYDIQLAGSGELVMTDLRGAQARLNLAEDIEGRLFLRNWGNQLVAELQKRPGRSLVLSLEPGRYHVTLERPGKRFEAELGVARQGEAMLRAVDFVPMTLVRTAQRGGSNVPEEAVASVDAPSVAMNLSLMPPLATNTFLGPRSLNHVSIGVLGARSLQLRGVGLAAGVSWVDGTMEGLQTSGLVNVAGGEVWGAQVALGGNLAFGGGQGVQVASLINSVEGSFTGLQLSGTANRADAVMRGLQLAAGVNAAETLKGVQVGLINLAGDATGTQIGLINVGNEIRGLQLGILNIAEDVTVPIGLLSIVRKGRLTFEVWADDIASLNLGLKYGSRHVYVLIAYGAQPWKKTYRSFTNLGLGLHVPFAPQYSLDLDLSWGKWHDQFSGDAPSHALGQMRVMVGWELKRRLALFAGVALHYYDVPKETEDRSVSWLPQWEVERGPAADRLWPGLLFGVRI
ncbi:caspase family protein [Stigmatella sp. ncwal1]|uniref:Caspase family protein n=1 Tax=Stigmatella ashevillensis TaxID=2995309 RepID=A0ABT5D037_9BACT|nr:caspase family protein [Stigmatella ashevillena]MDC0707037.1 caspase family protein [Stigmatella ashevillena]